MQSLRLKCVAVDGARHPTVGQVFCRDTMLSGVGLRVGAKSKVFFVEGQGEPTHAAGFDWSCRRFRAVDRTQEDVGHSRKDGRGARHQCREMQGEAKMATVDMVFDRSFKASTTLSPSSVGSYRRAKRLYGPVGTDWHNCYIQVVRDDV